MKLMPDARNELDLLALYFILAFVFGPLCIQFFLAILGTLIPLPQSTFALSTSPPAVTASVLMAGLIVMRKSSRLGIKFRYSADASFWVYAVAGSLSIYAALHFFDSLLGRQAESRIPKIIAGLPNIWRLIYLGVLAPIFEEYVFRGLLHSWFCKKYSVLVSATLTTTVFVLLHFQIFFGLFYDAFAVLMVACLLMALRVYSMSLGPSTLAHSLNNVLTLIW
jgi:membrane protease YdiL (CAAX protease family)